MRTRLLLLSALVVGALPAMGAGIACAGEGPSAALVVDTGSAITTYCVSLGSDSVTGIELVQLAGEQHGLDYSLGFGGRAVCMLEGVGPTSDDCFEDYPDFWGYWQGDGSGGWRWSSSGAASTRVEDGDIEGWSWGSGQDGSSHQRPPVLTYKDVCGARSAPPAKKKDNKSQKEDPSGTQVDPEDRTATTEGSAENDDGEPVVSAKKERSDKKKGAGDTGDGRTDPSPGAAQGSAVDDDSSEIEAAPASSTDEGGPPFAGAVALVFSILAGLGAAVVARRRARRP